ncbi:recombinase family protein [Aciduricibacillus chroicocephali]|uniref:Recombinase family protein n=1 Tax=Aciduricibacillus chroicocephali TaxID=3054939 RepID=A0ABY9KVE7_9BACI|nr:recombinase family protein [Bacillaceae bacterium 44XB]
MIIGYMRPNSEDENCEKQLTLLKKHGCDEFFVETHASAKRRVELQSLLSKLSPGDKIVFERLFTLGDSTKHLKEMIDEIESKSAFLHSIWEKIDTSDQTDYPFSEIVHHLANFQSDMISESTKKGLYEAKQKGTSAGRPRKPDENVKRAITMYESKKYTLEEIKQETGISKSTLYRYLEK